MGHENRFLNGTINGRALCTEPLPGVPLIEICDRKRVLIENHGGIIAYGSSEIFVKVRYGQICVTGDHLKLTKMNKEKLIIMGKIHSVTLNGRE